MSEITRVASWSLRALGCPIGAVDRMARLLAVSEVLEGGCLEALRLDEARLSASFKSRAPVFAAKNPQYGVVDASGRTFLDIGPRAIDLLTGIAKIDGTARLRVQGALDLLSLSGACTLAADRGVAVLAITADAQAGDRSRWALYVKTPSGVQAINGRTGGGEAAILALLRNANVVDASLTSLPAAEMSQQDEASKSGLTVDLIGFAPRFAFDLRNIGAVRSSPDWQASNVSQLLHAAFANGVDVKERDLKFLYELETRTWAPSSERSRMQAGFGAPSPSRD